MEWFVAALNGTLLCLVSVRLLNYYQLGGYRADGSSKIKKLALSMSAYGVLNAAVCYSTCFVGMVRGIGYFDHFYVLFCILGAVWFYFAHRERNARTPLKFTKRCVRLCIIFLIVSISFCIALCAAGSNVVVKGVRLNLALQPLAYILSPALFALSAAISYPIEQAVARIYTEGCKKALDAKTDLVRIGVTGSYGKTGVKNILAAFLCEKYRVYATPASYNTPMGICISVRDMPDDTQVFVAEMGAKRKGDVGLLCDIVKPVVAVITGIAAQHLATFGSLENVIAAKSELSDYVAERGGKSYFNTDNDYCKLMYRENTGEKYRVGAGGECFASRIRTGKNGSEFTLEFSGGEKVVCRTPLLGAHNVSNITLAAAVAYGMGVAPERIAAAAGRLRPVSHRLELITTDTGVTVIDDGYNSNEQGTRAALQVLKSFDGRRIVACQGLVEMGKSGRDANFALGREIAFAADIAVLIGPNADDMRQGALSAGMKETDVFVKSNLAAAQELFSHILRRGDVLLIENDLPDGY